MKKQMMILALTLLPAISFAKVTDFDDIITENFKAQSELHTTVKGNINEARTADENTKEQPRERIVVVEKSGTRYNSPTKADLLAFKKEKRSHRASEEKQFERLANEMRNDE